MLANNPFFDALIRSNFVALYCTLFWAWSKYFVVVLKFSLEAVYAFSVKLRIRSTIRQHFLNPMLDLRSSFKTLCYSSTFF